MPGGYRDEHITHYERDMFEQILRRHGFIVNDVAYVGGGEMILKCHKKIDLGMRDSDEIIQCLPFSDAATGIC
jgi:hypothetical protein